MAQVMPQLKETLFEMGDFPPVALLVSTLEENDVDGTSFINDMVTYLKGDNGTNTHPLFLETIVSWIARGGDFAPLVATNHVAEGVTFFVENKKLSEEFLKHCIRFRINPVTLIDWTATLSQTPDGERNLTIDDAYYITAVENKINVPAYFLFVKIPNKLDNINRLRYESIKAYSSLQKRLHAEGQQYTSKQVFAVAELYSIDDIITLVQANNTLEDVLLFNKFGLIDVKDIIENGANIPKEWLKVIE